MTRIKGWNRIGGSYISKKIHPRAIRKTQIDIRYSRINKAYQVVIRRHGLLERDDIDIEKWFDNKKDALKFAKEWMHKHPYG